MKRWLQGNVAVGFLALVGALVLASPGVEVARADLAQQGPACSSGPLGPQAGQDPSLDAFLGQVRLQAAASTARESRTKDGDVVLNNRGYNYSSRLSAPPGESGDPPRSPVSGSQSR